MKKNLRNFLVATTVLAIGGVGIKVVDDYKSYEERISNLNKNNHRLEESERKLQVELKEQGVQILNQKGQIDSLNKQVDSLKQGMKQKDAELNEVKSELVKVKQASEYERQIKFKNNNNSKQSVERGSNSSSRTITVTATAYTANCKGCSGVTAKGTNVRSTIYKNGYRIISVDPRIIPLGSVVKIDTGKEVFKAVADDTGSAIKNGKIDLLVSSYSEAVKFGRKDVKIEILR